MRHAPESTPEPTSSSGCGTVAAADSGAQLCSICSCSKSSSSTLMDLSCNSMMERRLKRYWKLPADTIRKTLRAICVKCVCKLNMHSEVTRSLMQRLQRVQDSPGRDAERTETSPSIAHTKSAESSLPIADAEVSTTSLPLPQEVVATARSASRDSSFFSSSHSVLEAYTAQPSESPTALVSGGLRNKNSNSGRKKRKQFVCQHCERPYFRKDHFTLHERRCWRQNPPRHPKYRVRNEADRDDDKEDADNKDQQTLKQNYRTFQCKQCKQEFRGVVALRQHQRTKHQRQHTCILCEATFGTKYEWELHFTICSAKQEALCTRDSETLPRTTRAVSRTRTCSQDWYEDNQDDEEDAAEQNNANDAVSVADTMYTNRMNFTGDWIVNHSRSNSNSAHNLFMLDHDDYVLEESQITTDKEYDLYLLDLLKAQIQQNVFSCFAPTCHYQTNTLMKLMRHDYNEHWKMSWFYCQKCGDAFTSKVFLDYHLYRQDRGVYICHKCHDEFEFQHQLHRHWVLHSKGINYFCNYCRLEFLSETKLLAHCEHEQHSPHDERPLIRIVRELSIMNPEPTEPTTTRQYFERVLDIQRKSCDHPKNQPYHKRINFSIGMCEFGNQNPPNCVSCL